MELDSIKKFFLALGLHRDFPVAKHAADFENAVRAVGNRESFETNETQFRHYLEYCLETKNPAHPYVWLRGECPAIRILEESRISAFIDALSNRRLAGTISLHDPEAIATSLSLSGIYWHRAELLKTDFPVSLQFATKNDVESQGLNIFLLRNFQSTNRPENFADTSLNWLLSSQGHDLSFAIQEHELWDKLNYGYLTVSGKGNLEDFYRIFHSPAIEISPGAVLGFTGFGYCGEISYRLREKAVIPSSQIHAVYDGAVDNPVSCFRAANKFVMPENCENLLKLAGKTSIRDGLNNFFREFPDIDTPRNRNDLDFILAEWTNGFDIEIDRNLKIADCLSLDGMIGKLKKLAEKNADISQKIENMGMDSFVDALLRSGLCVISCDNKSVKSLNDLRQEKTNEDFQPSCL